MKKNHDCFIVINPVSGGGKSLAILSQIEKVLGDLNWNGHFFETTCGNDLQNVAFLAIQKKCTHLICIGGDGTVNGVVNSIFKHKAFDLILVVIPAGTGGDYARTLYDNQIPQNKKEWGHFFKMTKPSLVDVGQITLSNIEKKDLIYFCNILGIGISSKIVQDKNAWAKYLNFLPLGLSTSLGYIAPTLSNLINYKGQKVLVESDNKKSELWIKAIFVAKGKYSGGGMKFGKNALLSDGLFDCLVCLDIGPKKLYKHIAKLYSGNFEGLNFLQRFKTSWANFIFERPIDIEYDGEVFKNAKEFKVEIAPVQLKILKK